ncbi:RNA polymerase sigma factor [Paenibacillus sp. GCM10012307]|uniref:RNA polymerase sigma factor n=1 Tax=Paenibacillus roseus TaxID=2798579 RepID=A0A934J023_9BACL|nr:RNA polymerase sigma factor [Paenibacillus roseus]MBJ6362372.1 RNA polymerase sigma factor [Paenibacillus roseus]
MEVDDQHLKNLTSIDEGMLREVMEQYGEDVWNYAYFLTSKHDWADDIAQEVFIKVYKHIGGFRREASLKTWLLKLTRNTAFSYKRLAFFRKMSPVALESVVRVGPSAETEYWQRDFADAIWGHVLCLPVKFREALILSAHYEMSHDEIAEALGISPGTVKSRLHRARRKLAELVRRERHDSFV